MEQKQQAAVSGDAVTEGGERAPTLVFGFGGFGCVWCDKLDWRFAPSLRVTTFIIHADIFE